MANQAPAVPDPMDALVRRLRRYERDQRRLMGLRDEELLREDVYGYNPIVQNPPPELLSEGFEDPTDWLRAYLNENEVGGQRDDEEANRWMRNLNQVKDFAARITHRDNWDPRARQSHARNNNTNRLRRMLYSADNAGTVPRDGPIRRYWERAKLMLQTADWLLLLDRFTDERNAEALENPLLDRVDLDNDDLRVEWVFQRTYQRILHSKYLRTEDAPDGPYKSGVLLVRGLAEIAECLSSLEHYKISHLPPPDGAEFQSRPHLRYIGDVRRNLLYTLDQMADAAAEKSARYNVAPGDYIVNGVEDPMEFHFVNRTAEVLTAMDETPIQVRENIIEDCTMEIMELLRVEYEFENRLSLDHVDDFLVSKRLAYAPTSLQAHYGLRQNTNAMNHFLQTVERANRQRRNFRLLREWSGGRPWKQLWRVYGAEHWGNGSPLFELQQRFRKPPFIIPADDPRNRPSHDHNVASHLFDVHPLNPGAPPPFYNDECYICLDNYQPEETLMSLHCDHIFHVKCVFGEYFDAPGRYNYRCPVCKVSPGLDKKWTLPHQKVGIAPRHYDAWDYDESQLRYGLGGRVLPEFDELMDLPEFPGRERDNDDEFFDEQGNPKEELWRVIAGLRGDPNQPPPAVEPDDQLEELERVQQAHLRGRRVLHRYHQGLLKERTAGVGDMN